MNLSLVITCKVKRDIGVIITNDKNPTNMQKWRLHRIIIRIIQIQYFSLKLQGYDLKIRVIVLEYNCKVTELKMKGKESFLKL